MNNGGKLQPCSVRWAQAELTDLGATGSTGQGVPPPSGSVMKRGEASSEYPAYFEFQQGDAK